jgi:hypothetical protein
VKRAEVPVTRAEPPVKRAEPPVKRAEVLVTRAEVPVTRAEVPGGQAGLPALRAEVSVARTEPPKVRAEPVAGEARAVERSPQPARHSAVWPDVKLPAVQLPATPAALPVRLAPVAQPDLRGRSEMDRMRDELRALEQRLAAAEAARLAEASQAPSRRVAAALPPAPRSPVRPPRAAAPAERAFAERATPAFWERRHLRAHPLLAGRR